MKVSWITVKIFFDTEFTGLYKDTELISIGLVDENGREFYGEITDFDKSKVDEWIKENVLLNTVEFGDISILDICDVVDSYYVGTKETITNYLKEWLKAYDNIELVSDVCHYDMVLFIDLFGTAFDLPSNINASCHDINQDIANYLDISERDAFDFSRETFINTYSVNDIESNKHNALYDAKVIRKIYNIINNIV